MILVDAGPLVALVDADDQFHRKCVTTLKGLREPLATVWPPLTEAMYLLGDLPKAQEALWEILAQRVLQLLPLDLADVPRMRELMSKYADWPMDLADPALVGLLSVKASKKSSPWTAKILVSTVFTDECGPTSSPEHSVGW